VNIFNKFENSICYINGLLDLSNQVWSEQLIEHQSERVDRHLKLKLGA